MSDFIKIIISLSVSGGLLFLVILLVSSLFRKKTSRNFQYYIWLLVLIRLLWAFSPEYNLVGQAFRHIENQSQTITDSSRKSGPVVIGNNVVIGDNVRMGNVKYRVWTYLFLAWCIPAAGMAFRKFTKYQSFTKYLKAGCKEADDPAVLDILSTACEDFGIKRGIELYINPLVASPLLIGVWKPCIVLPHLDMDESQMYYVLSHEIVHYKKKDLLYKWFMQLILCLYWFQPVFYYLNRRLEKDCEFACDEMVLNHLESGEHKKYGDMLIYMFESKGSYKERSASLMLHENAMELKARLNGILSYQKNTRTKQLLSLSIASALMAIGYFIGCY